ncbi:hypothetical protein [Candidatus Viadribacter manganicus]|uniref:Uncharacterized protein n=1 Tax=Candidatus Viadribacter manganicus TaxID=1759059 RepID=A0A1B1AEF5_9PROT|nr:hypothetical protein [Candidatus Viadribacter manganicus]ANP44939.1 hypothetical protein ATE48_02865 [Candidatus Viadribacter manganicus]
MRFFRQIGDLKGWKRFGFEVAIIVIGLSITLIAQELITSANRARATREAIDAVEVDMVMLYLHASERLAVEPCRRERFRALADRLQRSDGYWAAEIPESINRNSEHMVLPRVLRSPRRPWSDATWRSLLAGDAAIDMDRQRFIQISAVFVATEGFRERQDAAFDLAGELSHLSMSGPFDAAQRREAYATLSRLASMEGIMTVHARQAREAIMAFDFQNERRFFRFTSSTDGDIADFIANTVATYGACVDTTQFQPFIDDLNATTGMNVTLPRSGSTP